MTPKNDRMLKELKKELKDCLAIYSSRGQKNKREIETRIAKCFIKLAELATIRYRFNFYSGLSFDIENIQGEIVYGLWEILKEHKFVLKRLKTPQSTYNFFMTASNNIARYNIRKLMRQNTAYHFCSLEAILNSKGGSDIECENFFRAKKIWKHPKTNREDKEI